MMRAIILRLRSWVLRWPMYRRVDRVTRCQAFDKFRLAAQERFDEARQDVWEMQYFADTYGFYVVGAGPGQGDARSVDIFFGTGIYCSTPQGPEAIKATPDPAKMVNDAERGAALCYRRLENGAVLLLLYPARTDRSSPLEQTILLGEVRDPSILADAAVLRTHLRWLVAYMARTSLDGALLPCQWLRIGRLRLFRRWQQDDKWKRPRILTWGMWLVAWFFSVGLSGTALAVVQAWLKPAQNPVATAVAAQQAAAHQDAAASGAAQYPHAKNGQPSASRNHPQQP